MAPRETAGQGTTQDRTDPWSTATHAWLQTMDKLSAQVSKAPSALRVPTDLFVQWITFNERFLKTNLDYFLHLASRSRSAAKNAVHEAASTAADGVDVVADVATSGAQAAADAVTTGVEITVDAEREQAAEQDAVAETAEQERVEAEAAARAQAAEAAEALEAAAREAAEQQAAQLEAAAAATDEAAARDRYLGVKKAVLAEELAHRGLPRTGTIPALIERLVADDAANPTRPKRPLG